jgi:hypothetical protein
MQVWKGIVCRHILAALRRINAMHCPLKWFNGRWLKDEEQNEFRRQMEVRFAMSSVASVRANSSSSSSSPSSQDISVLSDVFRYLLERAINDAKAKEIVLSGMESLKVAVQALHDASDSPLTRAKNVLVQNPLRAKTKGAPRTAGKRLKPAFEQNQGNGKRRKAAGGVKANGQKAKKSKK